MSIGIVISLLGGLAFFLFGMRTMGEGLERAAGPKLKHFLSLMTRNRVIAVFGCGDRAAVGGQQRGLGIAVQAFKQLCGLRILALRQQALRQSIGVGVIGLGGAQQKAKHQAQRKQVLECIHKIHFPKVI